MATFTTSTTSGATVTATSEDVWAALTDPALLATFTPFLHRVTAEGDDHWVWEMTKVPVLGKSFAFTFRERMTFDEPHRIEFTHDPAPGAREAAGVEGEEVGDRREVAHQTRVERALGDAGNLDHLGPPGQQLALGLPAVAERRDAERPEGDVIGAGLRCLHCEVTAVMTRHANLRIAAEDLARLAGISVRLPEMDTVGTQPFRQ